MDTKNNQRHTAGRKMAARTALMLTGTVLTLAVTAGAAEASTNDGIKVGPGHKWGQIDVTLGSYTNQAASGLAGTATVCKDVVKAARKAGPEAAIVAAVGCTSYVGVCSVNAKAHGKRAGMTIEPLKFGNFWCWTY